MPNILADILNDLGGEGARDRLPSRGQDWDWGDAVPADNETRSPEASAGSSADAGDGRAGSAATAATAAANRDSFLAHILNTTADDGHDHAHDHDENRPITQPPARSRTHAQDDLPPSRSPPLSEERTTLHPRPESPTNMPKAGSSSRKRKASDADRAANKHSKKDQAGSKRRDPSVDQIDLASDEPLEDTLQKQRAEQVKAQAPPAEKPLRLSNVTCVICMDTPKDLTATSCGHVFCHTCLMEALIAGEQRAGPGEQRRSQCPVCRKALNRTKAGDIIPLLLKQKLPATQPRRRRSSIVEV